jgi:hypothetical protein
MWPFRKRSAPSERPERVVGTFTVNGAHFELRAGDVEAVDPPVDLPTGEVLDDAYFVRLRSQNQRARAAAVVRGRPLWDWIPVIDEHKRAGRLADARDLTMECIDAMEKYSDIHGYGNGAAGWYFRAGIIYRRLGDYDGELAVIDRGLAFMPNNDELLRRREKAIKLRG